MSTGRRDSMEVPKDCSLNNFSIIGRQSIPKEIIISATPTWSWHASQYVSGPFLGASSRRSSGGSQYSTVYNLLVVKRGIKFGRFRKVACFDVFLRLARAHRDY
jgi:hypothetical protein